MEINIKPREFNRRQIEQAETIDVQKYYSGRMSVWGITIDDATTVDRDDGIWLVEREDGNFELQVSITDVSQLILKDSPIDKEAQTRVVTLYHTQPPTPMLPCHVSTNLGSLEEGKQTLALTVFFIIDRHGNVNSVEIKETIFTNQKAFSYDEVETILKKPANIPEHQTLCKMQKISQLISKNRNGKSGILTDEGYIDEDGNLIRENSNAHQLIAELMILTNKTIASFLAEKNVTAIYRTQDVGISDFKLAIKTMGHCLVPALYEPEANLHVSLGVMHYTHFTSPLRRFVDLVNHRILKRVIQDKKSPYTRKRLEKICEYINTFTQQFKLDRSNFLREKRSQDRASKFSDLGTIDWETISQDDLSDLIQYYAFNNKINIILPQLKNKIKDLQPKDLYYLWFVARIDDFWQEENLNTISVLLVKSQLDNAIVDYQYEYDSQKKIYFCSCYINDLTTPEPIGDRKKNKAKQKAALATIKGYVNHSLVIKEKVNEAEDIPSSNTELDSLNNRDFSKIIEEKLIDNLDEKILTHIEQRINNLPVKDLYKIWFEGKVNRFWDNANLDAVSVLLIHSQLTHCTVEYQFDYFPEEKHYQAYCYVDGLTHPSTQYANKKNKAKQKAALAYIKSYLNNELVEQSQPVTPAEEISSPQPNQPAEETSKNTEEDNSAMDWVSQLNTLSQLNNNDEVRYDFDEADGIFICTVNFLHHDRLLKSTGYGRSKKEAKQLASQVCFIQHDLLN